MPLTLTRPVVYQPQIILDMYVRYVCIYMFMYVLTKVYASNVTEGDHSEASCNLQLATCLAFDSGSQDKPEVSHIIHATFMRKI